MGSLYMRRGILGRKKKDFLDDGRNNKRKYVYFWQSIFCGSFVCLPFQKYPPLDSIFFLHPFLQYQTILSFSIEWDDLGVATESYFNIRNLVKFTTFMDSKISSIF